MEMTLTRGVLLVLNTDQQKITVFRSFFIQSSWGVYLYDVSGESQCKYGGSCLAGGLVLGILGIVSSSLPQGRAVPRAARR